MGESEVFAMATSTLVPLSEYLKTSYRPDRDWIDGEVRERNRGEGPHSAMQKFLLLYLSTREKEWGVAVWPEHRVQTSETHYRIPDLCATRGDAPFERIIRQAPVLCIEIMSHDERMSDILERVEDYLGMGVLAVWVVDPRRRRAFLADSTGVQQATERLWVPDSKMGVELAEVFGYLDALETKGQV
jgi:Uma2 family endonuclease